jgi:hypothetical protein
MELNEQQKQAIENLKKAVLDYKACMDDQLGIITEVYEILGFKAYPSQSMLMDEDITFFVNDKGQLVQAIFQEFPDDETLQNVMFEDYEAFQKKQDEKLTEAQKNFKEECPMCNSTLTYPKLPDGTTLKFCSTCGYSVAEL